MKGIKTLALVFLAAITMVGCSKEPEFNDEGKLTAAHTEIKTALGEGYLPNAPLETLQLEEMFGINPDHVENFIAEMPMIGMHPDVFIGIEATDGNVDAVESALLAHRDYIINESLQYPMNQAKVNATQVLKIRNHVFFVLLGAPLDDLDATEDDATAHAEAEVQKAVDAITATFE